MVELPPPAFLQHVVAFARAPTVSERPCDVIGRAVRPLRGAVDRHDHRFDSRLVIRPADDRGPDFRRQGLSLGIRLQSDVMRYGFFELGRELLEQLFAIPFRE